MKLLPVTRIKLTRMIKRAHRPGSAGSRDDSRITDSDVGPAEARAGGLGPGPGRADSDGGSDDGDSDGDLGGESDGQSMAIRPFIIRVPTLEGYSD